MEKASYGRQKCQLLEVILRFPNKTDRAQTWFVVRLATGKNAPCFACHQDPAQTVDKKEIREMIAPLLLDKVGQSPKFLHNRKVSQIFWTWQP